MHGSVVADGGGRGKSAAAKAGQPQHPQAAPHAHLNSGTTAGKLQGRVEKGRGRRGQVQAAGSGQVTQGSGKAASQVKAAGLRQAAVYLKAAVPSRMTPVK